MEDTSPVPLFSAVSTSARQLFLLLRCIHIAPRTQVQISASGIQFAAEDARVVHGKFLGSLSDAALAFLDKALFATYNYSPPVEEAQSQTSDDDGPVSLFQLSLPALLETLQIFISDPSKRDNEAYPSYRKTANPLDTRVLGMSGLCRLTYEHEGAPLVLQLSEGNVTTTCSISTYAPEEMDEIPLERNNLSMKVILRSSRLYDAIVELESTNPNRLTITAGDTAPHFLFSSAGPLGSTSVEFSRDPNLLETFEVGKRVRNTYRYGLVKLAARTMALASKVSVRSDWQGVLSMQFMIELDGEICFVDFRFLPLIGEDWDMESETEE